VEILAVESSLATTNMLMRAGALAGRRHVFESWDFWFLPHDFRAAQAELNHHLLRIFDTRTNSVTCQSTRQE
jgi:hypothetical protein